MSVADGVTASEAATEPPPAVLYEVRDSGVAVLTFNRPERMNAWGGALASGFYSYIEQAEADPRVRVIVMTGRGRAFCAGADMGGLDTISATTVDSASKTDVSALVAANIRTSLPRSPNPSSPRSTARSPGWDCRRH